MARRIQQAIGALVVVIGAVAWAVSVQGQVHVTDGALGEVTLTGFLRVQSDIHTGPRNPNTDANIDRFDLNQFRTWLLTDTDWKTPVHNLRFFLRTRVFFDHTPFIERHFKAFSTTGKNAKLTRVSTRDAAGELWEGWGDYTYGDWWLRVGRQNIVWGDVSPTRLLDDINPLDLSFHGLSELSGREAFDNIRIPIWAARGAYTIPFLSDTQIEGYVSPSDFGFIPTQLPARNSPFDLLGLPPFITLRDDARDGERGVSAGLRFVSAVGPVNYTINWITRRSNDGITQFESIQFDERRCISRIGTCIPLRSMVPFGGLSGDRLHLVAKHPRFNSVGASANYFEAWTKTVVRFEGVFDINRPFELRTKGMPDFDGSPPAFQINEADRFRRLQFGYAVAFDRPTFVFRRDRTAMLTLQFEQRVRGNPGSGKQLGMMGRKVDRHNEVITLLFSQPFAGFGGRYDEWFLDYTMLTDTDNAFFFQPAVRFEPGNHWRFAAWFNSFKGPENRAGTFGSLAFARGVNLSVSYQY
ncbi:MAG: DUF1302 family protein [Candidatus Binatia bacterium]